MGTAIKHPVPDRVKPSFVIFLHLGTLTLLYSCIHTATVGIKGLTYVVDRRLAVLTLVRPPTRRVVGSTSRVLGRSLAARRLQ